ncbi:MAG: dienelactone hydrolase family protein [Rhodobacteraceae bacterium]|nr:dienelactone hydrolase family protein [Paracoccaceae bacterium]
MAGSMISVQGKDGEFPAYLSMPPKGGPGVVVIQEIFGINTWVRSVCDMMARNGFVALAPDLFWRMGKGIELHPFFEEDFQAALGYYGKYSVDQGVEDIQAAVTKLRGVKGCTGKVGNMGFCLGGALSYLSGARTDTDASSGYYGVGIDGALGEVGNVKKPMLLHIAGSDPFVPKEAADKIQAGVKGNSNITVHLYPGLDHGFCRDTDPSHYNAEGTKLAHGRTIELFKKALA